MGIAVTIVTFAVLLGFAVLMTGFGAGGRSVGAVVREWRAEPAEPESALDIPVEAADVHLDQLWETEAPSSGHEINFRELVGFERR